MEHRDPAQVEPDLTLTRRQRRADALRRRALSPFRIILMVLALPLTTGIIAVNIYLRTSEFDRNGAVMHLIALAGCDATNALGLGPFRKGYPGYHKRYDPDGDGVSCGTLQLQRVQDTPQASSTSAARAVGNAKFIKP